VTGKQAVTKEKSARNLRRRSPKGGRLAIEYPQSPSVEWSGRCSVLDASAGGVRETEFCHEQPSFVVEVSPEIIQREKEKARVLKKTRWWQRQMERGTCFYCQKPVDREAASLDHIVPLIRGGRSTRGNMVLACKSCNSKKKYLLPMEWEDYLHHARCSDDPARALANPVDAQEENRDE
jgi:5-methylcytosine-specific restriction enzyme A